MARIRLGDLVKDRVTGFEGVAICRSEWLNRCVRITIQPRNLKDGKVIDGDCFDIEQLEVIKQSVFDGGNCHRLHGLELGDLVKDQITGFKGVVECVDRWLNGVVRMRVQPQKVKDGEVVKGSYFDVNRLELSKKEVFKRKKNETGGPMPKPERF